MRRLTLGVIGHVDHGKTALVRALTGMETDRLPEEKRRGISIALGFAHAVVDDADVDFIDMPGHERFVRTMVSGATGVDAVLLVVSAAEGLKPQTIEHVEIAGLLGVRRAVIAVSKADLVDEAAARTVGEAAVALATRAGLATSAPVLTSTVDGRGLDTLRAALADVARQAEPPADLGWPSLPIDRAFVVAGHGTVVTGALRGGRLAVGRMLELVPVGLAVQVRGLQVHGRAVDVALPGQRVAANLRGVEVASVGRGATLAQPGLLPASTWLTVQLRSVADGPELRNGARLQLLLGTAEVEVRLRLLDRDALAAGETAPAQLRCAEPVAAFASARLVLRFASPAATVAGGRVLDQEGGRSRRRDAAVLARLERFASAADEAVLVALALAEAEAEGVPQLRLARLSGLSLERASRAAAEAGALSLRDGTTVLAPAFQEAGVKLLRLLESAPNGLARERLASRLHGVGAAVLDEALARLVAGGKLRREGGLVRRVRPVEDRARAETDAALQARLAYMLRRGGFSPPDLAAAAPSAAVKRALDRLARENLAVRTYDRVQKREIVFHREAIDAARRALTPLLSDGPGLLVGEIGSVLGTTRKFSVPLLEHLDAVGFTKRIGERRVLARRGEA